MFIYLPLPIGIWLVLFFDHILHLKIFLQICLDDWVKLVLYLIMCLDDNKMHQNHRVTVLFLILICMTLGIIFAYIFYNDFLKSVLNN